MGMLNKVGRNTIFQISSYIGISYYILGYITWKGKEIMCLEFTNKHKLILPGKSWHSGISESIQNKVTSLARYFEYLVYIDIIWLKLSSKMRREIYRELCNETQSPDNDFIIKGYFLLRIRKGTESRGKIRNTICLFNNSFNKLFILSNIYSHGDFMKKWN